MKRINVIGTSGSGKSTLAKNIAEKLNLIYVDTGAMFRALALYANINKVDLSNINEVQNIVNKV